MPTHRLRPAAVPLALAVTVTALVAGGCSSGRGVASSTTTVVVPTTAPPSTIAPVSEAPIPPTSPVQEIAAPGNVCPYIDNDAARQAEGDRVGRVTLTTTDPVGCNFYWQYDESRMILQISVANYPSQSGARNAMIRDTASSSEVIGVPGLVPGVDAVLFRTSFYPPDGPSDWACAFATASKVVTVKTQQNDVSFNAKNVAVQIAPRFMAQPASS